MEREREDTPAEEGGAPIPAHGFPRRAFLSKSALGTIVLGASSLLPAGCAKYEEPDHPLVTLSPREFRILDALADTIVPPGDPVPPSASQVGVARDIDRYMTTEDPAVLGEFRSALLLIEFGPPFHSLRLRRFTAMSHEERTRYVEGWLSSRLAFKRMLAGGLKKAILFAFYCHHEVWPYIGYDGPWVSAAAARAVSTGGPAKTTRQGA